MEKLLVKLKVFDPDNTLSLTNVCMLVLIGKVAAATVVDWTQLVAFFMALAAYNGKKVLRYKTDQKTETTTQTLEAMQASQQDLSEKVRSLTSIVNLKNLRP